MNFTGVKLSKANLSACDGSVGVYAIYCLRNMKSYVGASLTLGIRLADHIYRLRKGTHQNNTLQNDFNKYGEGEFRFYQLLGCEEKFIHIYEHVAINSIENKYNKVGVRYRPAICVWEPGFHRLWGLVKEGEKINKWLQDKEKENGTETK